MAPQQRFGGSFAPPLDAVKLATYRSIIESSAASDPSGVPGRVKDSLLALCNMHEEFYKTPRSSLAASPHPSGVGTITPLEEPEIVRMWDLVPWDYELKALQEQLDKLEANSPLRTPAFHLLWYAWELTSDREPLTNDRLPKPSPTSPTT